MRADAQAIAIVSGKGNKHMPIRMNMQFPEMVLDICGSRTFNADATTASSANDEATMTFDECHLRTAIVSCNAPSVITPAM
jgi:hypothetical protein